MDKEYEPTDYVYPACLPESSFDNFEGIQANVSGWGSLDGEATVSSVFKQCQLECLGYFYVTSFSFLTYRMTFSSIDFTGETSDRRSQDFKERRMWDDYENDHK